MQRLATWQLLAICVGIWSTTWYAVTYQVAPVAPEVALACRFLAAGGLVLLGCRWFGVSLRCSRAEHARLALQGIFLYGLSYICVYYAEREVASGLVAVGYSASPLIAGLGAWAAFGARPGRRFLAGGLLGIGGVALIFWPGFETTGGGARTALGATLTAASVLLSTIGSLVASRNRQGGLPFWPSLGFGMLYGGAVCSAVAIARGAAWTLPETPAWWITLAYLTLAGSIFAFACFLTLQERIGPGRTGTIGVMTPLLALPISVAFEGFRPDAWTVAGALLAVLGNAMMLDPPRPRIPAPHGARIVPAPTRANPRP